MITTKTALSSEISTVSLRKPKVKFLPGRLDASIKAKSVRHSEKTSTSL